MVMAPAPPVATIPGATVYPQPIGPVPAVYSYPQYQNESGYRGDVELGYGDEYDDEEEEDVKLLFWGVTLFFALLSMFLWPLAMDVVYALKRQGRTLYGVGRGRSCLCFFWLYL
ncbi:unnamed protein product [Brassica rapa]|uniref:Uncharacterized protein n=1 Tax=Brassica campestris TaxID=3711 RepID=A0A3P6A4H0_BRACM|nr:unnamed protein product [Brassica rapa]VDC84529.1 unnamed protein product [Brassica rapa]